MNGIMLLNPNFPIRDLNSVESFTFQKILCNKYVSEFSITQLNLNPYQMNSYYTIPHALLYDLEKSNMDLIDCLIIYSLESVDRFIFIYPEKWQSLCNYFRHIVFVNQVIPFQGISKTP